MREWLTWLSDGKRTLAFAIVFATLIVAWFLRYETVGNGWMHRNRLTGNVCHIEQSCWFCNGVSECMRR